MSEQTPLNYESLPPSLPPEISPAPRWPGYIAWAIILLAVAFVIVSNREPELKGKKASANEGVSDIQLSLAGKYAIGAKALSAEDPSHPAPAELGMIMGEVDSIAKTPDQQIRAAMIAAEMQSSDDAAKRLDRVPAPTTQQQSDIDALKSIYTKGVESVDADQKSRLASRYGYLGQVADTFGLPSDNPARHEVLNQARRVVILSAAFGTAAVIGGLVGLVLFIVGIVLLGSGVLHLNYTPPRGAGTVYVEMFAVYIVSFLLISLAISYFFAGSPPLAASWIAILVLPIAIGWAILREQRWSEIRQALGWHGGRGWYIEIPLGLVGYFAGLPVIVVGFLITAMLIKFSGATPTHPILSEAANHSPLNVVLLLSIASLWAPVIEETMFRGALFSHMRRRWNWFISAGVVALIFAIIHPQGWTTVPALASIAIVLAGIREWRGSILASMTAHAFHNAVLVSLIMWML